jgi:hypothetical protein
MPSKYEEASARTHTGVSRDYADEYVAVGPSKFLESIGAAGSGLYASRPYNSGDVIVEYTGKIISVEDSEKKKKNRNYFFEVRRGRKPVYVIDSANNRNSSAAKFVNTVLEFGDRRRNAEFVQRNMKIYLKATKSIKRGQEIIGYYGENTQGVIDSS